MRSVHVVVTGLVQGVGYRAWVERHAVARGLDGWVRNRRDGTVEAVFHGEGAVDDMLRSLWDGPSSAAVSNVVVRDYRDTVRPGFAVRPTE